MKLRFEKRSRIPQVSGLPALCLFCWSLGLIVFVALSIQTSVRVSLCHFTALTGYPCAACGSTRAVLALLRGEWWIAWHLNPLMCAVLFLSALVLIVRLAAGRQVVFVFSRRGWQGLACLVLLLLALNWWHVLHVGGLKP